MYYSIDFATNYMLKYTAVFFIIILSTSPTIFAESDDNATNNFHQGSIQWIDKCITIASGTSIVRLTDYDMNKNSEDIEHFDIKTWSNSDRLEKNLTMTETGKDTGIFEGTVFFFTHDNDGSSHRIRISVGDTVFAKYVDESVEYNIDGRPKNSEMLVIAEIPILEPLRNHEKRTVEYGPCTISYVETVEKTHSPKLEIFYPAPLKQIESGLAMDEIKCKENLELILKHDNSPACVSLETKAKLMQRGWAIDPMFYGLTKSQIADVQQAKFGCKKLGNQTYCVTMVQEKTEYYLQQNKLDTQLEPEPSPEPRPETTDEQDMKKDKARIKTQEIIMTDYRGNQHQMDAINEYRNEFESGYFLEQYIHTFDKNYERDELVNFTLVEWGYRETDCTYPKVELYFMPYETKAIEKIGQWEKPHDNCFSIDSDGNGYVIADVWPVPGIFEPHEICTIPGEYRISVTNLKDMPDVEWGYFTCQKDILVDNPEPWMDLSR